ncbi:MAG: glycosyltransferase family 2 protein [Acidobacteria bacterium]|nr:glycosyltransferase family 2 protein [Acidobacteriota bacterium]
MRAHTSDTAADVIIPVCNQYSFTRNLLEGIYRYTDRPFHIYIIDNASSDETADLHKIYTRDITIVRNRENRGWSAGINQGIQLGHNPYLIFMNNDVEVSQGWLGNMISFLDTHPRIGVVGPLNSGPGNRQCVDRVRESIVPQIPRFLTDDLHERNRILKYHFQKAGILIEGELGFFCVALKRRTIDAVGLLDEGVVGSSDDEDYCRRLRKAGYVLGLSLDTYVLHHTNSSSKAKEGKRPRRASRKREGDQPDIIV